jgi:hypothetical protein
MAVAETLINFMNNWLKLTDSWSEYNLADAAKIISLLTLPSGLAYLVSDLRNIYDFSDPLLDEYLVLKNSLFSWKNPEHTFCACGVCPEIKEKEPDPSFFLAQ